MMDGGYGILIALCVVAGGACWLLVYADAIRMGFRQRNGCIPLFVLGLHIAWEGLYACADRFFRGSAGAQVTANGSWLLLELLITATWFLWCRREAPEETGRKWLVVWSTLALACCPALQVLDMAGLGNACVGTAYRQGNARAGMSVQVDALIRCDVGAQAAAGAAWLLMDLFVVILWARLARKQAREAAGGPWSALALIGCLAVQQLLVGWLGGAQGEKYAAYLQSIAMSVACLYMLSRRRTQRQTALIAACKILATLTFAVCGAVGGNGRMAAAGAACIALDTACMACLRLAGRQEKAALAWKGV